MSAIDDAVKMAIQKMEPPRGMHRRPPSSSLMRTGEVPCGLCWLPTEREREIVAAGVRVGFEAVTTLADEVRALRLATSGEKP